MSQIEDLSAEADSELVHPRCLSQQFKQLNGSQCPRHGLEWWVVCYHNEMPDALPFLPGSAVPPVFRLGLAVNPLSRAVNPAQSRRFRAMNVTITGSSRLRWHELRVIRPYEYSSHLFNWN